MNLKKHIKEANTKTELYAYKLILNTQIIDFKESLNLIEKQLSKIELREPSDIEGGLAWNKYSKLI